MCIIIYFHIKKFYIFINIKNLISNFYYEFIINKYHFYDIVNNLIKNYRRGIEFLLLKVA